MEHFYLEIRAVHIGAVAISGILMLLRGLARNAFNASWAMSWPLKALTYSIDTVLLTAALMLTTIIQQFPFVDGWLTMKLLLLLLYILLGYQALRGRSLKMRWLSLAGAALAYGSIASVARAHNVLGVFA